MFTQTKACRTWAARESSKNRAGFQKSLQSGLLPNCHTKTVMFCWSVNWQRVIPQVQGVPNHLVIDWLKGPPICLDQTMEFQGRCGKRVSWNLLDEMAHFFLGSHWG